MVTSNKQPDKKVVKMADQNSAPVVPQRTLLGEVNEHITCPLCRGYYIDATTIVECLHSFCRSCIIKHLQVKSYCPVCEMMINSAKPNIKLDKALQDIVYKLVPGLFQKEMERRQQFYSSRPGPAACATPEQRGEDTERIIFSPEDVISFSLEYYDVTDTDSISSKSSDSSDPQPVSATTRRYLQCPAVVNINHLKKFLSMKFDIDSTQFAIDILYKRVPLPDYYTLMDIAYIYNWKRNEPMRFFYQITDYVAIRNRLFEINRKSICPFDDRKSSPAPTEDTTASSPPPHLNDQGSEVSSGTDSPMPDDSVKHAGDTNKVNDCDGIDRDEKNSVKDVCTSPKKNEDEVKKSQFLNSFELTAKSNCVPHKTSPSKLDEVTPDTSEAIPKPQLSGLKIEGKVLDPTKRKCQTSPHTPELKRIKMELEETKASTDSKSSHGNLNTTTNINIKIDTSSKGKDGEGFSKKSPTHNMPILGPTREVRQQVMYTKPHENQVTKKTVAVSPSVSSPKCKPSKESQISMPPPTPKVVSPLKLLNPKPDISTTNLKASEVQKQPMKKMPDLKPSGLMSPSSQMKVQSVNNKVRMDLLANNSDPTCDRSKILSQVKTSLSTPSGSQPSGDPLKSLFDSCRINIPSSLSITLTDQKLESQSPSETGTVDSKKSMVNKNLAGVSSSTHKVPSPPVHNYIEILKLPDTETGKKQGKMENNSEVKLNQPSKTDVAPQTKPATKSSENQISAKGPVPNLKPIADTKLSKQSGNFSAPITFQQTFEQQLQHLQSDKKTKLPKSKAQVPKLVPATPKSFNVTNKPNTPVIKPNANNMPTLENKSSAALDLSTPHNIQNQLLTMQSIDNLAKKQSLPTKGMSLNMTQSNVFPSMANRPLPTGINTLRIPPVHSINLMKSDKGSPSGTQMNNRHDIPGNKPNSLKTSNPNSPSVTSPVYHINPHTSPGTPQPSPRSQTRSPSSSPKLVIAEEKQGSNCPTSEQIPNLNSTNTDLSKVSPGTSKIVTKPMPSIGKLPGVRQPIPTNIKPGSSISSSAEYLMSQTRPQLLAHHQNLMLRHQMEMSAWTQMYKRSNMVHQIPNEFNNKDKQ